MTRTRRLRTRTAVLIAVGVVAAATAPLACALLRSNHDDRSEAKAAADRFLDRYMGSDGRVVRTDQGGDTVSEGQAYAMLLAVAIDDRRRFDLAWNWARHNLVHENGLMSWRWKDGKVLDTQPAADADLDAARALVLAERRFGGRGRYRAAAVRIAKGVLADETVRWRGRLVLVAGPWARADKVVNPSYFSPRAYGELHSVTGDRRWNALARSSRKLSRKLLARPWGLAPDWAKLGPGRRVRATGPPSESGGRPQYGYDAVRTPVRLAEACKASLRAPAARSWSFLREQHRNGRIAPIYGLKGDARAPGEHAAGLTGAAGAARAAGAGDAARTLLDRAEKVDREQPTYYGSAWVALGRVALTTDMLGGC